jgi:glutamate-1-semialdehyde 2,1-aminomutase
MAVIDRGRLSELLAREDAHFGAEHPRSQRMYEEARGSLLAGVPMPWMTQWAGRFPVFVESAEGSRFTDIDGKVYVDFCLGDTGAMTGHSPKQVADVISEQAHRGITLMLPSTDAVEVSKKLADRFALPYWQFCLTATDANRFTIRIARELTGRPKILVFSWCYHGTVDETFVILDNGIPKVRPGAIGPPVDPTLTTRVVEWNDVEALERELAFGDVACVLTEPVLTNIGIIHPEPGFHDALRELTRAAGTYLVIDETHTLCAGPYGYTGAAGLAPDFITVGKPIASGLPAAAYGMSAEVGEVAERDSKLVETSDIGGIGGTLSGNALSLAAIKATLDGVLTQESFDVMIPLAERFEAGVEAIIRDHELPWHVTRLGCRVEYAYLPTPPRNGAEAAAAVDHDLDRYLHLFMLNRGILMTPFHNMALMSPATSEADVDLHTQLFEEATSEIAR